MSKAQVIRALGEPTVRRENEQDIYFLYQFSIGYEISYFRYQWEQMVPFGQVPGGFLKVHFDRETGEATEVVFTG